MDSQIFFKSFLIAAFLIGIIVFAAVLVRPGTYSGSAQGGYSGERNSNTGWIQNWSRGDDDDD